MSFGPGTEEVAERSVAIKGITALGVDFAAGGLTRTYAHRQRHRHRNINNNQERYTLQRERDIYI